MATLEDDVFVELYQYEKFGIVLDTVIIKELKEKHPTIYKDRIEISIRGEIHSKLTQRDDIETFVIVTEPSLEGRVPNSTFGYRIKQK